MTSAVNIRDSIIANLISAVIIGGVLAGLAAWAWKTYGQNVPWAIGGRK